MLRMSALAAAALLLLSHPGAALGADIQWPGWRGPGRDGRVQGYQTPESWPQRLKQVWQVEVGTGYASPVVAAGRVFQHARQGEDEVVWCLDLQSGEVHWQQRYAAPFKIGGGGEYHGKGPKSSPALAHGRLFTMSIAGLLSAWDAESGKLLWKNDYRSEFDETHPYWGASTSPLVEENRVIVHFGGDEAGALIALDAATGKEVWRHGQAGASYASPILVEIDGVRQIVELNMDGLAAVETRSGRLLWKYPYPQLNTDQNMVTPAYHGDLILLGGENRGIRGLLPQRKDGQWTVEEKWHQKEVALDMSSAVMNDGLLYGMSHYDSGRLFCLEPKSGEVRWQGPPRVGDNVAFLSIPGYVVALLDNGTLQVLRATGKKYDLVQEYQVSDNSTWAPPVLLPNSILIKDHDQLTRWSLTDEAGDDK